MIRLFTSHLVVCSLNVLCRAWLLLKRRFASRASPKHPSEPWTVVVKTDRFTSGAQGRDLLEPLIHGPQRTSYLSAAGSAENTFGTEENRVWWSSQALCSAAAL